MFKGIRATLYRICFLENMHQNDALKKKLEANVKEPAVSVKNQNKNLKQLQTKKVLITEWHRDKSEQ